MTADDDSGSKGASRVGPPDLSREPALTPPPLGYRADIDGLRAVAVIAVLLYHLELPWAAGGFVGVDVFFVISGYLITSILLRDLAMGKHSISRFYARRMRRLFPALFVCMLSVACAAAWLFAPDDFKRVGQSMAAAATFLSNFYFAKDSGYFTEPAASKPLLHTWSLSVEEQFYIFFPLYLRAIHHLPARRQLLVTIGVAGASLAASVACLRWFPVQTFYFLPTRIWQLLSGALLAFAGTGRLLRARPNLTSLAGMALVLAPVFLYSGRTPFPGVAAVPPSVGAVLLIATGPAGSVVSRALSSRPLVAIGRMSYSIYLWHFPLIGFASYLSVGPRSAALDAVLLVASLVLGGLSFALVEQRFRHDDGRRAAVTIGAGLTGMVVLACAGVVVHLRQGFASRFSGQRLALVSAMTDRWPEWQRCMFIPPQRLAAGAACRFGPEARGRPSTLVWGDSHAEALAPGIIAAADRAGASLLFAGRHGCAFGSSVEPSLAGVSSESCELFDRSVIELLARSQSDVDQVVLASRWVALNPPDGRGSAHLYVRALDRLVDNLSRQHRVWLVGPVPGLTHSAPRGLYVQSLGFARGLELRTSLEAYLQKETEVVTTLERLCKKANVRCLWPHTQMCTGALCDIVADGKPLYFDDNHLSAFGARHYSSLFDGVFEAGR